MAAQASSTWWCHPMVGCCKLEQGFAVGGLLAGWSNHIIAETVIVTAATAAGRAATDCGRATDTICPSIHSSCSSCVLQYSCTHFACHNHAAATVVCSNVNHCDHASYNAGNHAAVDHTSSHCSSVARFSNTRVEC